MDPIIYALAYQNQRRAKRAAAEAARQQQITCEQGRAQEHSIDSRDHFDPTAFNSAVIEERARIARVSFKYQGGAVPDPAAIERARRSSPPSGYKKV